MPKQELKLHLVADFAINLGETHDYYVESYVTKKGYDVKRAVADDILPPFKVETYAGDGFFISRSTFNGEVAELVISDVQGQLSHAGVGYKGAEAITSFLDKLADPDYLPKPEETEEDRLDRERNEAQKAAI